MIIKKAAKDEGTEVIELVKMAIEDMAERYTGYSEHSEIDRVLGALFLREGTRFSYEHVHVLHYQDRVAGQITAYPVEQILELNQAFRAFYNPSRSHAELKRVLNAKEGLDGEFYIDNLAVLPMFRGNGFAKHLIKEVELLAGSMGYDRISLLVDLNNTNAELLYERLGFQGDRLHEVLGHPYKHMIKFIG